MAMWLSGQPKRQTSPQVAADDGMEFAAVKDDDKDDGAVCPEARMSAAGTGRQCRRRGGGIGRRRRGGGEAEVGGGSAGWGLGGGLGGGEVDGYYGGAAAVYGV